MPWKLVPNRNFQNVIIPFVNPEFGEAMNQDGRFGGVPIVIHDGTDSVAWTATNIVGTKMTPDSTDAPITGAKSVKIDNASLLDVWEFDNGSNQVLSGHVAFSLHANVLNNWTVDDNIQIYGWDGSEVGNRVDLGVYFDQFLFGVTQAIIIPLSDMGLSAETITGLRMQLVSKSMGRSPTLYIDDFQLEQSVASSVFEAASPVPTLPWSVLTIIITLTDDIPATLVDNSALALSENKILDIASLANGIIISHIVNGSPAFQAPVHNLADMLAGGFSISNSIGDGGNTLITLSITFGRPLIVFGDATKNHVHVIIRDDLRPMVRLTANALGFIELP